MVRIKTTVIPLMLVVTLNVAACNSKQIDGNFKSDDTNSIGTEMTDTQENSLARKLSVPESCELTFDTGDSGLSSITLVDDSIEVPDAERVYKVSFEVAEELCSEDEIKTIVESLFDNSDEIRFRSSLDEMTKDELDLLIEQCETKRDEELKNGDTSYAEALEEEMERLREQKEDAPDELPRASEFVLNGIYVGEKDGIERTFEAVSGMEDSPLSESYFIYEMTSKGENDAFASEVDGADSTYVMDDDESTCDEAETNTMTESDAIDMALGFFDDLNVGSYVCTDVQEAIRAWTGGDLGENIYSKPDGYRMWFSRGFEGMEVVYFDHLGSIDNFDDENLWYKRSTDKAIVTVNESGIVSSEVYVFADEASFVKEDVDILKWDDFIAAADKSIAEYYTKYPTDYSSVEFNDVKLAYVPYVDSYGDRYFVPAWILSQKEYSEEYRDEVSTQLACINAVDGSYIDISESVRKLGAQTEIEQ